MNEDAPRLPISKPFPKLPVDATSEDVSSRPDFPDGTSDDDPYSEQLPADVVAARGDQQPPPVSEVIQFRNSDGSSNGLSFSVFTQYSILPAPHLSSQQHAYDDHGRDGPNDASRGSGGAFFLPSVNDDGMFSIIYCHHGYIAIQ